MILLFKSKKTKMLRNYKGKYFSIEELLRSDTANRLGIDNEPTYAQMLSLKRLIDNVLDPVRELYGKPIYVNSGFRCAALNKKVGGVSSSQHCKGEAADLDTRKGQAENLRLFTMIQRSSIDFDQLINEDSDHDGRPNWVHVSYRMDSTQRNQTIILRL